MDDPAASRSCETKSDDGLSELVHRAAKAIATDVLDSGGMLEVRPAEGSAEGTGEVRVAIDAQLSDDGLRRTIAKLDLHVGLCCATLDVALVEAALTRFGGTAYANVAFGTPEGAEAGARRGASKTEDALDITVDFSSAVPFHVRNLALTASHLAPSELAAAQSCLRLLGVGFTPRAGGIRVARHQLRGPLRPGALAAALAGLVEQRMDASVYASTIPPTQGVRIAARRSDDAANGPSLWLEICFSRGLAGTEPTTPEQTLALEGFVRDRFGFAFGGRRWTVVSRRSAGSALG